MQYVLSRLSLLIVISLILISLSGGVMAQEISTLQDPCWPLSNPPAQPDDDSVYADIKYRALHMAAAGEDHKAALYLSRLIEASPDQAAPYALRGCLYTRIADHAAVHDWETFIALSDDEAQIAEVKKLIAIYSEEEIACHKDIHYETQREARHQIDSYDPSLHKVNYHNLRGLAYLCLGAYDLAL